MMWTRVKGFKFDQDWGSGLFVAGSGWSLAWELSVGDVLKWAGADPAFISSVFLVRRSAFWLSSAAA